MSRTRSGTQTKKRLIGYAFFALAIYLTGQAIVTVVAGVRPDTSPLGIAWLAATVVVMLGLATAKLRTGRALDHVVLQTEAKVTMVDEDATPPRSSSA